MFKSSAQPNQWLHRVNSTTGQNAMWGFVEIRSGCHSMEVAVWGMCEAMDAVCFQLKVHSCQRTVKSLKRKCYSTFSSHSIGVLDALSTAAQLQACGWQRSLQWLDTFYFRPRCN